MKRICAVLILLLASSCVGGATPAEVATYQAIAPEYRAYVEADMALSAEAKQRRINTIETWRMRVGVAK